MSKTAKSREMKILIDIVESVVAQIKAQLR